MLQNPNSDESFFILFYFLKQADRCNTNLSLLPAIYSPQVLKENCTQRNEIQYFIHTLIIYVLEWIKC